MVASVMTHVAEAWKKDWARCRSGFQEYGMLHRGREVSEAYLHHLQAFKVPLRCWFYVVCFLYFIRTVLVFKKSIESVKRIGKITSLYHHGVSSK